MNGLSDIFSVVSVDLRGHGESFAFEPPYGMDLLAEDCYHLLNDLDFNPPIIVCGLSMGGYIAFALYRKYPDLFRALILTSTRASADSPEGKANRDTAVKNVRELGVPSIADSMLPKTVSPVTFNSNQPLMNTIRDIMLETSINGVIGALQSMRDRPDSTPLLPKVKCPVLVLQGADDQLITVKEAELMQHQIPNSRLVVIPEAGHLLNLEKPDAFNQAVREFLLSLPQD